MNKWHRNYLIIYLFIYLFNAQAYTLDPLNSKALVGALLSCAIMELLMPSTAVCLEKKPHTKIHFQVTGIPRIPTRSISEPGWASAAGEICQGKNGSEEAATPMYCSFIWGRGGETVLVCALLFISREHLFPQMILAKDFLQLFFKAWQIRR